MKCILFFLFTTGVMACNTPAAKTGEETITRAETVQTDSFQPPQINDTPKNPAEAITPENHPVLTNSVTRQELVAFARTLSGVPYKYASTQPEEGFDCSGFITYVFNHFNIEVPRSSVDFTNMGKEIGIPQAMEGDLILFTGTNDSIRIVGHMGIVTENTDTLKFIHSSSGRANGVTITPLNDHYRRRFVKVIRVFPG